MRPNVTGVPPAQGFSVDGDEFDVEFRWNGFDDTMDQVTISALSRGASVTPRVVRALSRGEARSSDGGAVSIAQLLDRARAELVAGLAREAAEPTRDGAAAALLLDRLPEPVPADPRATDADVIARVAQVYRLAVDHEDPRPVRAVAEIVGQEQGLAPAVRMAQARSWVKIARRRRLLPAGQPSSRRTPQAGTGVSRSHDGRNEP